MNENEQKPITFTGVIRKIYYQAGDFTIGMMRDEDKSQIVRFVGPMPQACIGQTWKISGHWTIHPKYGQQIQILAASQIENSMEDALIRFFSSDRFKGIGKKSAQSIVETLGVDALQKIEADPDVLKKVGSLSPRQRDQIAQVITTVGSQAFVLTQMLNWGLSSLETEVLVSHYDDPIAKLKTDCFDPYYKLPGIGYAAGLKIANALKVPSDAFARLEAKAYDRIQNFCYAKGATCMPIAFLAHDLMVDEYTLEPVLDSLKDRGVIKTKKGNVYLTPLYDAEETIAIQLVRQTFDVEEPDPDLLEKTMAEVQEKVNITYDETQKEAIRNFFRHSINILNGGPGTGKSTLLHGLLMTMKRIYPSMKFTLCAPTGRAAKRMNDLTGMWARTIHSLLRWDKEKDEFGLDENNPLDSDLVVVDECSMVDTRLFASLLKALPPRCRILLIGDEDQLESVGPGNVLADLIASGKIPVTRLEKLYRQSSGSGISKLASEIRQSQPLTYENPVELIEPSVSTADCVQSILEQETGETIQVMAPKYNGDGGIHQLNARLQDFYNPFSPDKPELVSSITTEQGRMPVHYRLYDRILLKQNMPELEVYNGDIGEIIEVDEKTETLLVNFDGIEVEISREMMPLITHAWCISVHKSQGSEYPKAILVADDNGAGMLSRKLIYTGVSRAKRKLWIVGDRQLFEYKSRMASSDARMTTLKDRIEEFWD